MITSSNAQEKTSSPKHFWHTVETKALPEQIWSIWIDVNNWHLWDSGLQSAAMAEPFALKAKGKIVSLQGRQSKFKVVAYEAGASYTFKTKLPLGGLFVKRYLEVRDGKTYFTHEVWFKGMTAGLFAKKFGKDFQAMLPEVMDKIKVLAEQNNH
ncbi:MAG: SRPBCC family protein [Bacteroidota bacterium]